MSDQLSEAELTRLLAEAERLIEVGATYRHYKGNPYKVVGLAFLDAEQTPCVIYQALYGSDFMRKAVWVRPIEVWLSKIVVDGKEVTRFQKAG